jgi:hypothetical protein
MLGAIRHEELVISDEKAVGPPRKRKLLFSGANRFRRGRKLKKTALT